MNPSTAASALIHRQSQDTGVRGMEEMFWVCAERSSRLIGSVPNRSVEERNFGVTRSGAFNGEKPERKRQHNILDLWHCQYT